MRFLVLPAIALCAAFLTVGGGCKLEAQGILTVTPGRLAATAAGTGNAGYTGDGGAATSATLARPSGTASDAVGNVFVADANNHVVREISAAGVITTVAGTGVAGFGGDGGSATAAFLDTPTGVAVDATGNLYIADSHNHRIRKVAGGTITTVAGTGLAGFSGDGAAATGAQLALPSSVAVDASGNLYIADTNNQRIRQVAGGTITTVVGNGEELFAGDGGPATAASLDQPTGIAIDASGNLYIADKNNQRVRVVSASGTISTLAGSGVGSFAGAFSGDGGNASAAELAKPVGVSVDGSGDVFIADTNNQRIRQVSPAGSIATVAGTGDQGFAGDGGPAANMILNSPRGVGADASGNLLIADTRNQRLRSATLGALSFGGQPVGTISAPQTATLTNSGTATITVSSPTFNGPFALVSGGTCPAAPIALAAGASCTVNVAYEPTATKGASGSVSFGGPGVDSQTVLLAGALATQGATAVGLTESKVASLSGESVTFTAALSSQGAAGITPTGSITFYDGSAVLGVSVLANGVATFSTTQLPDGLQTITATYSGSSTFTGSSSNALSENVADYALALSTSATTSVEPGHSVAVPVALSASGITGLTGSVSLSAANLPAGLSVSFAPASVPLSNGQLAFTMNVTAAPVGQAANHGMLGFGTSTTVMALLLLPAFGWRRRRTVRGMKPLLLVIAFVGTGVMLGSLTGCGSGEGFFGQKQALYNVEVNATASDSTGGTLTRSTAVSIEVQ